MSPNDAMAIAKARVAEEAERRTGFLNLVGLVLDSLPEEVADLTALQRLACWRTEVSDLGPLSGLTALQRLACWGPG